MRRWTAQLGVLALLLLLFTAVSVAQAPPVDQSPPDSATAVAVVPPAGPPPVAPGSVTVSDVPNDDGTALHIAWSGGSGATAFRIERSPAAVDSFASVDQVGATATSINDEGLPRGVAFRYRVVAVGPGGEAVSPPSAPAVATTGWFNTDLIGVAIAILAFGGVILLYIRKARSGIHLFIRKIAGLDAVDEAVGRATEMGRPLLYIPGTGYISDIGTVASLNLLGEVAKKTAEYGTTIRVPGRDPVVYTVAREVVKGSHEAVGRPDTFDPNSVFFIVENALAYAAAVGGLMVREKPAANFFMGPFYGESLILAETGAATGAIQIAGTDQVTQLPFFVVACDYTLMGEELYAASAYIAREPLMLGALKGQDAAKLLMMILLIGGTIVSLLAGIDAGVIFSTHGY